MRHFFVTCLLLLTASLAQAFTPQSGFWWNPNESGRGFNIEVQDNLLFVAVYAYNRDGSAQWWIAGGPMTENNSRFSGTLSKFTGGQCLGCTYSGSVPPGATDGVLSIVFESGFKASVTFPDGSKTDIVPLDFGIGVSPQGLLGRWVFIHYPTGSQVAVANTYDFTATSGPTTTGTGVSAGTLPNGNRVTAELQKSGTYNGFVLMFEFSASSTPTNPQIVNSYIFEFSRDQAVGFLLLTQTTGLAATGYRTLSRSVQSTRLKSAALGASLFAERATPAFSLQSVDAPARLAALLSTSLAREELERVRHEHAAAAFVAAR